MTKQPRDADSVDAEHNEARYLLEELDLRLFPAEMGKELLSALDACDGLDALARAYIALRELPERFAAELARRGHKANGARGELHLMIGVSTEREAIVRVEFMPSEPKGEPCQTTN